MAIAKNNYETALQGDIIRAVAQQEKMSQAAVTRVYKAIVNEIVNTLNSGKNVKLHTFANFKLVDVPAHKARSPHSGETIQVPAKTVVKTYRLKGLQDVSKNIK